MSRGSGFWFSASLKGGKYQREAIATFGDEVVPVAFPEVTVRLADLLG